MSPSFVKTNVDLIRCMRILMEDPCYISTEEWGAASAMIRKFDDFLQLYERAAAMRAAPRSNF